MIPLFETLVVSLLVLILLKQNGWAISFKKKGSGEVIFHPNPLSPGGGYFEFPKDYDIRGLINPHAPPEVKSDKETAGYA